ALRLEPDNLQVKWNKSLLYLSQKKFAQGWALYDVGAMAGTRPRQVTPRVLNNTDYSLEYFRDKVVYIHSEQGIGDEIMFASCYQEIIDVARSCTVECDDRLAPLFQRSLRNAHIVAKSDTLLNNITNVKPDAELYISAASIPRFVRRKLDDFPIHTQYLRAYDKARQVWQARYKKLGDGLKIGISWRGGCGEESKKRSSDLQQWSNIIATPGCHFVNLQYGKVDQEIQQAARPVHDWPDTDHFNNIEQLAAQIAGLDLVITVSNVTAHLAGALGVPVWIMLPYSPNWRWFEGNNPSLWYKNARLFRQANFADWESVTLAVETELHKVLKNHEQASTQLDMMFVN
ncbi:MAG: hypothetical protein R3240_12305, partial [Gammaproteobacteria bacterium]|nr:hypothetical protein [Gammaproteobacteria bacterium]